MPGRRSVASARMRWRTSHERAAARYRRADTGVGPGRPAATGAPRGRAGTPREQRLRALIRLQAALPVPLLQATKDDMYEWRAGLTVGPTTINTYVSNVREFYRWALARGLISADPSAGIPVPPIPRR